MSKHYHATRKYLKNGWIVCGAFVLGAAGWSSLTTLSSAVVVQGKFVVDGKSKKIQHLEGGLVREIRVKDGDIVKAGQVLIRLDKTVAQANFTIVAGQIDELVAQRTRLEAELADRRTISWPSRLKERLSLPSVIKIVRRQNALFQARLASLQSQEKQLLQRLEQTRNAIRGEQAQKASKKKQLTLATAELAKLRRMFRRRLISEKEVLGLEREVAKLTGEIGAHDAEIARARSTIGETRLKIIQLKIDRREKANADLRVVIVKLMELEERYVTLKSTLDRTEIRASRGGIVHDLSVHTIGGVIAPAATVMRIVPTTKRLLIEVKIEPRDIDKVKIGQDAAVRLTAFNADEVPQVSGRVAYVSADLQEDTKTGESRYVAKILIKASELQKIRRQALLPGMPAEVYIRTGDKSPLAYLIEPITDQLHRAMRED